MCTSSISSSAVPVAERRPDRPLGALVPRRRLSVTRRVFALGAETPMGYDRPMSQKHHRGAQRRAEKRHRREVERRQARTAARKQDCASPRESWHPSVDDSSVPSADEETVVHPYLTQREREREFDAPATLQRWRRAMPGFWTHAEVAALADDALFAGLADRGLVVTRADVLAHIARMPRGGSAWRMSRIHWLSAVAPRSLSAPDRDFLGLAAVELWRRLRPDDPPLEALLALLADAEDRRADDDDYEYLEGLVRFFAAARVRIEPDKPSELGGVRLPLLFLLTRMVITACRHAEPCPELAADVLAETERWSGAFADEDARDRAFLERMQAHLLNELGRHHEAEQRVRAALTTTPDDSATRRMLARQLHEHPDGDRTRLVEALDLWDSTRPFTDDEDMDLFQRTRDEIAESLRLHDSAAASASA